MIQLIVDGVFLDMYEKDLPKVTLAFDSLKTFQPQSSYSETFRLPATNNNFEFFKNVYEVNGIDFDVTIKREAYILVNGSEFVSGELRLKKVYISKTGKIDYEVLFMGKVRDFAGKLGSKKLNELDLSELTHDQNMTNVKKSWEAYPSTVNLNGTPLPDGFDNGLTFSNPDVPAGTVVYPLVDFGNTYDSNESVNEVSISVGNNQHITQSDYNVVPVEDRLGANRFKPMVRVKYIFDKIFEEAGYTYTSNFFNAATNPFRRLYLTAWGNEATVTCPIDSYNSRHTVDTPYSVNWETVLLNIYRPYFDNQVYDNSNAYNEQNRTWTANKPGTNTYRFIFQLYGSFTDLQGDENQGVLYIRLYRNGQEQFEVTMPPDQTLDYYYDNEQLELDQGDQLWWEISSEYPSDTILNIDIAIASFSTEGDISISSLLQEDYKQADFIKDVLTTFKLVMVPDKSIDKNFIIERWDKYIGTGVVRDWTHILNFDKDIEIEPLFYEQKEEIYFKTIEEKDWLNNLNEVTFKERFGELKVDSNNELLKDSKDIEVKYASTPVTEIQGANNLNGNTAITGRNNMVIPHIYTLESGNTRALKRPIEPKSRFLFYNGLKYTGRTYLGDPANSDTTAAWYWRNDNDTGGFSLLFPQATPYQYTFDPTGMNYNNGEQSLNLTWQAENGYLQFGTLNPSYSLYDEYWRNFIDLLYNKNSRRLTAYFILSAEDLNLFEFKDVIFIKDTYYFVEKIESVPIGEKDSVRVSLIKLLNYKPDQDNYIPPTDFNIWEEMDVTWDGTDFTWND